MTLSSARNACLIGSSCVSFINGVEDLTKAPRSVLEDSIMRDANTLPAPELNLSKGRHATWEKEHRALVSLPPTLLATHKGRYVAIHNASVIADGPDQIEVAMSACARAGYVPIYVGLVTDASGPWIVSQVSHQRGEARQRGCFTWRQGGLSMRDDLMFPMPDAANRLLRNQRLRATGNGPLAKPMPPRPKRRQVLQ
jgi:hypothetical protein